ncbi:MAG: peptidylprolyl isomerase [Spirochaetia bacterium]
MKLRLVLILLTIPALLTFAGGKKEASLPENAVASVNGVLIPRDIYDLAVGQEGGRPPSAPESEGESESEAGLDSEIIKGLVDQELLLQESKRRGVEISREEVDAEFDKFGAQFPDEETLQANIAEMGYTEETLKGQIEKYLYITTFVEEMVTREIPVSEEEIRTFYDENPQHFTQPEQIQASHILLTFGEEAGRSREEAEELARSLITRLEEGADFAELAANNSEDPSAERGGDLGTFGKGQMVQEFEEAAFALETGEISGIVETDYGLHIIKVTDKKEEQVVSLDMVSPTIESHLKQVGTAEAMEELLASLREESDIVTR